MRRVEEEETAYMAKPQKVQQERKPACPIREKAQKWQRSSVRGHLGSCLVSSEGLFY